MAEAPSFYSEPPETVADEGWLREHWRILTRHRRLILAVFIFVVGALSVRSLLTERVYQATVKVLIERERPKVLSFKEISEVGSETDDYYQTQYKLIQSRSLARNVIVKLRLLADPEFGSVRNPADVAAIEASRPGESLAMESAIDILLRRLKVQPDRNSRLVNVAFDSGRPDVAAKVANTLAELYIEQTLEFRYETSAEAGRWLDGQIREQRKKLNEAELALQRLKEQQGIVNIEERRALLEQKLKELGTAATTLKTERLEKEVSYQQMKAAPNPEDLSEALRSSVVQSLRVELGSLGRKEVQLAEKYLDAHPELLQVRKQIADTRARLAAEARRIVVAAENEYETAANQEASLLSALEASKAEALELSRRSLQYDSAKREVDAAKAVLDSLLSRSAETDVSRELKASNIRIVDPAVIPRHAIRPNRKQDLLLATLLGLGLGSGLALLIEGLNNRIRTPEDVRVSLRAPLLGVIAEAPAPATPADLVLSVGKPPSAFVEGYRVLRTALMYSWPEHASRVVMVTSTVPGEGKTLTSLNLALTLASTEGNVLLIDADLRRPQAHEKLGLERTPGLSDVLVGRADLLGSIKNVPDTRLGVLVAGTSVPSPADLMTVSAMKRLVDSLRQGYDWIIIDTPPVAAVAEPLILASLADGVVIVVAAETAPRSAIRETLHQISAAGGRLLGVLLNRARFERHSYYYGSYYGVRGQYEEAHR